MIVSVPPKHRAYATLFLMSALRARAFYRDQTISSDEFNACSRSFTPHGQEHVDPLRGAGEEGVYRELKVRARRDDDAHVAVARRWRAGTLLCDDNHLDLVIPKLSGDGGSAATSTASSLQPPQPGAQGQRLRPCRDQASRRAGGGPTPVVAAFGGGG